MSVGKGHQRTWRMTADGSLEKDTNAREGWLLMDRYNLLSRRWRERTSTDHVLILTSALNNFNHDLEIIPACWHNNSATTTMRRTRKEFPPTRPTKQQHSDPFNHSSTWSYVCWYRKFSPRRSLLIEMSWRSWHNPPGFLQRNHGPEDGKMTANDVKTI